MKVNILTANTEKFAVQQIDDKRFLTDHNLATFFNSSLPFNISLHFLVIIINILALVLMLVCRNLIDINERLISSVFCIATKLNLEIFDEQFL